MPAAGPGLAAGRCDPAADDASSAGSPMSELWELRCDHKRGTFIVRTYLPNFLLPLHVSSSLNRAPSTPKQGVAPAHPGYSNVEAKLQLSLRAKVFEGLLLPHGDLWFMYTQRSLWQVWNSRDSAPFRSTDYQPEALYVLRAPEWLGKLPAGWRWRMFNVGIAHQSNGQSDPLSRSWNRVYAGAGLERGDVGLQVRVMRRLHSGRDDNPDLTRYIGGAEVLATWFPGLAIAALTWRTGAPVGRGSLQLDWTFPVRRSQPLGLRWYAQLFTGYGETLLDYNHRQNSIALGLTLFQF